MDQDTRHLIDSLKNAETALTRAATHLLDTNLPEGNRAIEAAKAAMAAVLDVDPYSYGKKPE